MKHIVLFSGGCGSAYTAWLVAQKENKKDIVLLHTSTFAEYKDTKMMKLINKALGIFFLGFLTSPATSKISVNPI